MLLLVPICMSFNFNLSKRPWLLENTTLQNLFFFTITESTDGDWEKEFEIEDTDDKNESFNLSKKSSN